MDPLLTSDDDRTPAVPKESTTPDTENPPADSTPPPAQTDPHGHPVRWKPSPEQIKQAIAEHKQWRERGPKNDVGKKALFLDADLVGCGLLQGESLQEAVFDGADLSQANLVETNLTGASLVNAKLRNAIVPKAHLQDSDLYLADLSEAWLSDGELQGAKLREANLRGATLNRAKLNGADLYRAVLTEADLQDADLTEVTGLLSNQLAGTNLSGATLPEAVAKFDALKNVSERSQVAKRLFTPLLLGCIYALLIVAGTTDLGLLTNAVSPLPVTQAQIPISGLYFAAPVILVGLYLYSLLHVQRIWESLAKLPAVFPDGTPLDEKVDAWLLAGLVRSHLTLLKKDRPPFSKLQALITIVLGYWIVPITLIFVWGRYLRRHDWMGTGIHAALLVITIGSALVLQRLAAQTLQGKKRVPFTWKTAFRDRRTYKVLFCSLALVAVWGILSYGAIEGHHPDPDTGFYRVSEATRDLSPVSPAVWVPQFFHVIGYAPYLDLTEQDVSTKPPNWTGQPEKEKEELALVTKARLDGADLRYANAPAAFLAKADLSDANLERADLSDANLQGATLIGANLQGADLGAANLQGAYLIGANLQGANLFDGNLQGADLGAANLQGADLVGTNLQGPSSAWPTSKRPTSTGPTSKEPTSGTPGPQQRGLSQTRKSAPKTGSWPTTRTTFSPSSVYPPTTTTHSRKSSTNWPTPGPASSAGCVPANQATAPCPVGYTRLEETAHSRANTAHSRYPGFAPWSLPDRLRHPFTTEGKANRYSVSGHQTTEHTNERIAPPT